MGKYEIVMTINDGFTDQIKNMLINIFWAVFIYFQGLL